MTKNMKLNPHERNIHIAAVSDIYTVYEIVPERKAVARLTQIRNHFEFMLNRQSIRVAQIEDALENASERDKLKNVKLIVKTGIHNPEFHFN